MAEIIKRTVVLGESESDDGGTLYKSTATTVSGRIQAAYNSWGHLTLRFVAEDGSDTLIVLDKADSRHVIEFIRLYKSQF